LRLTGGDIGVSGGSAITGFPPGLLSGLKHSNDAVAIQAQSDLVDVYNDAANTTTRPFTDDSLGDLGGLTLTEGVYGSGGALSLTGTLTLDAQGNENAVFVFRSRSALTVASNSVVRLINGARYCRVYWVVPSDATIGTYSTFVGHVFAMNSIWVRTGATVQGQLLARDGEVTLQSNHITNGFCADSTIIHVTKTAAPSSLTGPGSVTYTYRVTNPGASALTSVTVLDDKLGYVTYVSGDSNGDGELGTTETWTFTATTNLTATTTNIATAAGSQTGTTTVSVDNAAATVVVAGLLLPDTATPWYNLLLVGAALALLGGAGYWMTNRKMHA
jgi:LPXTG-motif cell wall-anchored protein